MADIVLQSVCKSYKTAGRRTYDGPEVSVLANVSLTVSHGQFVTLVGPNGCGKSTLLNLIAGLTLPTKGSVQIGGQAPSCSQLGFVFQGYSDSLLPWRTTLDNIAFPLELRRVDGVEREAQVQRLLDELNLDLPLGRYPYQLSAGQQQMVAIARALIHRPDVLLMDEPFSQLDYHTRLRMNDKVLDIWRATGATIVFVSHDLEEALLLGDRVLFLGGSPTEITSDVTTGHPRERDHRIVTSDRFRVLLKGAIERVAGD